MSFPISPSNGEITVVNGITYTYNSSEGSWTRSTAPVGNLAITGNLTANKVYTANGLFWSGNGVAFSSGGGSGEDTVLRANVGAYQTYANANAATQATSIDTINANIGAYYNYANANIGTLYNANISTNANLGAYQTYANANAATQATSIDTINANIGSFYIYANANIGTLFLGNTSTQANIGAFYTYANANIGTLFLGNTSTQANLGAFQTYSNSNAATQATGIDTINANLGAFELYANTKIGTNTNSNLVVISTTDSVSATTGALVVAGGVGVAGNLYVAGNIFASNLVSIGTTTLTVTDPLLYLSASDPSPYNYDIGFFSHFVGGTPSHYQHTGLARDYATNIWGFFSNIRTEPGATIDWSNVEIIYDTVRLGDLIVSNTTNSTSTTTGALRVAGGVGVAGNVVADKFYTTSGLYWAGNGVAFSGGGSGTPAGSNQQIQYNNGGAFGASSGLIYDGTSLKVSSGNVESLYSSGDEGGEFRLARPQTNTTIAGDISIDIYQNKLRIFENGGSARGFYLDITSGGSSAGTNIMSGGGGGSGTPGGSDTQMQFNDGGSFNGANITFNKATGNLVISSVTTSTSATTGALVVAGGVGIAGNVVADKLYTSTGIYWAGNKAPVGAAFTTSSSAPADPAVGSFWYKTTNDILYEYINDGTGSYWVDISTQTIATTTAGEAIASNVTIGGNLLITGTITGSVGYLLERANIVASAPPATTNLDLISASILYFTSNSTANITANIRGNSTVTLNSMLAVGQSSTFVVFMPNSTAYYVNTIKIDNTTVTPFWQGGTTVTSGNANSLDIYTFAVLKTADATFKVFASQVKYQNLGP